MEVRRVHLNRICGNWDWGLFAKSLTFNAQNQSCLSVRLFLLVCSVFASVTSAISVVVRGGARCCPDPCPSCQCTLSCAVLRAVLCCPMLSDVLFVASYAVLCCPVLSCDAVLCCPACTLVVCPSCPATPLLLNWLSQSFVFKLLIVSTDRFPPKWPVIMRE